MVDKHRALELIVAAHLRRYERFLFDVPVNKYGLHTDIDVVGFIYDSWGVPVRAQAVECKSSRRIKKATEQLHKAYLFLEREYPSLYHIGLLHVWSGGVERVRPPTRAEMRRYRF